METVGKAALLPAEVHSGSISCFEVAFRALLRACVGRLLSSWTEDSL